MRNRNITERRMRIAMRRVERVAERTGNYNLAALFNTAISDSDIVAEATEFCQGNCNARAGATFWETLLAWIMSEDFINFLITIIGLFSGPQIEALKKEAEAVRSHLGITA